MTTASHAPPLPPKSSTKGMVIALCVLGLVFICFAVWAAATMTQMHSRFTADCRVRERLRWEKDPEGMQREQKANAKEDAMIQEELDRMRAASWLGWLTVPKHPRGRGCDD